MAIDRDQIRALFERHGDLSYSGEPVTQLDHALQCAALAEADGASDALICAALLHDIGHLLNKDSSNPATPGTDDLHQFYGLPFLRPVFPDAVVEPIRLHVDAKRCLCAIDTGYFAGLTAGSVRSLERQGGVYSEEEAEAFLAKPYAPDAIRVRRWDDRAKVAGLVTPDLEHFLEIVARVIAEPRPSTRS